MFEENKKKEYQKNIAKLENKHKKFLSFFLYMV